MNCDHWNTKWVWSSWQNDYTGEEEGEWVQESKSLCVDISIGAFKCTRCGHVGYYTGKWREYYENGGDK